jgi:hypothetical protein
MSNKYLCVCVCVCVCFFFGVLEFQNMKDWTPRLHSRKNHPIQTHKRK